MKSFKESVSQDAPDPQLSIVLKDFGTMPKAIGRT